MSYLRFKEPRRWHFAMTHPDDEISVCCTIRRLVQAGHFVSMSWTHSNPVRELEARVCAAKLGVPEANLTFFGSTDGETCFELRSLEPKFAEMMHRVRPDEVVCGAFEQGHLDHDATNLLVHRTFPGEVLESPFYHTYITRLQRMNVFSDPTGQEVLMLSAEEMRFKLEVAKSFRSQNIWSVLLAYEAWQALMLRPAQLRKREIFRRVRNTEWRTPNHPLPLRRKVERHPTWQKWVRALDEAGI